MTDFKHLMSTAGSFLGVVVLGGAILVWPVRRELSSVRQETAELQIRVEAAAFEPHVIEKVRTELEQARQIVQSELKIIPESPETADLMRRLSLPVDGRTVLDQAIRADASIAASSEEDVTALAAPVTVEMQARFDSVFAVIRAAESMERLVRVATVRLSAVRDRRALEDDPLVMAAIGLEAIYEPTSRERP